MQEEERIADILYGDGRRQVRTMQRCWGASVVYSWSVSFLGDSEQDRSWHFSSHSFVGRHIRSWLELT